MKYVILISKFTVSILHSYSVRTLSRSFEPDRVTRFSLTVGSYTSAMNGECRLSEATSSQVLTPIIGLGVAK